MTGINVKPTYFRQRFLLAFIRQLNSEITAADLQKLVFLYTMEEKSEHYEFIPYKFGPYSFQLAEDVDILRRENFLSNDNSCIKAVGEYMHNATYSINNERGNNLIRKVYREYPYYAINSEMIGRLFSGDEADRFRRGREKYIQTEQMLFTIGYEGKSIEAFMNILIRNDIRVLCDVRKNPLSRKFGFSNSKLEHTLETIGIEYINIPELGIESDKRSSLETISDYQCLFSEYAKTFSNLKSHLDRLYSLLYSNIRIVIMCFEKEPEMCHRHVIRDYLTNTFEIRSIDL